MLRHAVGLLLRSGGAVAPPAGSASCAAAAVSSASSRGFATQFFDAPNGPAVTQVPIEDEWYNRQRSVLALLDKTPWLQPCTFIAPNAVVAGDVDIYDKVCASGRP